MKCLVIGLGGCSNGGKTTLSNEIEKGLSNVVVMNMDNFYRKNGDPKIEFLDIYDRNFANWDSNGLNSFNGPKFLKEFEDNYKKLSDSDERKILIVEGIFIFMFRARKYPRDEPKDYFERVAWPAYEDIKEKAKGQKDIVYLDGTASLSETVKLVLSDIKEALSQERKTAPR